MIKQNHKSKIVLMLLSLLAFSEASLFPNTNKQPTRQVVSVWQGFKTKDGDFYILLPKRPSMSVNSNYILGRDGAAIKSERVATAHENGAIFIVKMYETSDTKKLLNLYPSVFHLSEAYEARDITVNDFKGQQYFKKGDEYSQYIECVATKRRVYVLEAAARDAANPSIQRFLSSLKLGNKNTATNSNDSIVAETLSGVSPATSALEPNNVQVFKESEVTHKAIALYRSNPHYSAVARSRRIQGKVTLGIVFSSSGEVTNIKVIKGLDGGLTENAIEATKSIVFLLAEKDGRAVSQYAEIDYNFDID